MNFIYKLGLLTAAFLNMNAVQADSEVPVHCADGKHGKCHHKTEVQGGGGKCHLVQKGMLGGHKRHHELNSFDYCVAGADLKKNEGGACIMAIALTSPQPSF
ncbi:hypothetical protein [Candidatus Finniella inopinata]|uniref:DUF2282 domain-containing protein n=1 Tax=Candidatus Finniella inopinata TaxID=1696036 RepID=A0A4Q7DL54_9PROT|nr:hypothetical protein [Candidatus Finniella inopinata]RZI46884.1 hypothetical protein EQU50_01280 [Candidatus Finniella inopinata]